MNYDWIKALRQKKVNKQLATLVKYGVLKLHCTRLFKKDRVDSPVMRQLKID